VDEADDEPTRKRQRTRREGTARLPPGVPLDLALRRYGPPKLAAELSRLEAEPRGVVLTSGRWHPVWELRELIWRNLCGEVEQDRYCISYLSSEPTGARTIFPSDRCWYLKLPRIIPFDEDLARVRFLGFHDPGPDVLDYVGQELRGVLIH
jgi:hypothetical protein